MAYVLSYKINKESTSVNLIYEAIKFFKNIFSLKSSTLELNKDDFVVKKIFGLFGGKSKKETSDLEEGFSDEKSSDEGANKPPEDPWKNENTPEEDEEEILRYRDAMIASQVNPVAKLRLTVVSIAVITVLVFVVLFQAIVYIYKPYTKIKTPTPLSNAIIVNSDGFALYSNNTDHNVNINYVEYKNISYDAIEAAKAYINVTQKEYDTGGTGTCSAYVYNFSNQLLCSNSLLFRMAESNIFSEKDTPNWFKSIIVTALYFRYSEEEAIEIYLNTLRYNSNVYGIKQAAEVFFDKDPKDLNIIESIEAINISRNYQNIPYNVYKVSSKEAISMYLIDNGKILEDGLISLRKYLEEENYYVGSKDLFSHYESSVNFSSIFNILTSNDGYINDVKIFANLYQGLQNNIFKTVEESLSTQDRTSVSNTASIIVLSGTNDIITSFTVQKKENGTLKFHNGHPRSKPGYIIKPIIYSIVEGYAYEVPQILKDSLQTDMRNLVAVRDSQMTIDEQIESSKSARVSESYRKALRKLSTEVELQRLEKDFMSMEVKLPFVLPESVFEGYFTMSFKDIVKIYSLLINNGYYNNYQYYNSMYISNKLNKIPPLPARQILTETTVDDIKNNLMLSKTVGSNQTTLYYSASQNIAIGLYDDLVIGVWYGRVQNDLNSDATRENYAKSLDVLFKLVDIIANTPPYEKINPEDIYNISNISSAPQESQTENVEATDSESIEEGVEKEKEDQNTQSQEVESQNQEPEEGADTTNTENEADEDTTFE